MAKARRIRWETDRGEACEATVGLGLSLAAGRPEDGPPIVVAPRTHRDRDQRRASLLACVR